MPVQSLSQVLILLFATVLVLALARRIGMPAILGYLIVGIVLGPFAFAVLPNGPQTQAIAQIGVVFLLFTLGLEFSFPRIVVGAAGALAAHAIGVAWPNSIVVGGALAMCSTAIVLQQLGDQDELNRSHGRLSFAVLLFQDLAFVPLLALATVQTQGRSESGAALLLRLRPLRCWRSGAGCCGHCCMRSRTAGCASCSRLPHC